MRLINGTKVLVTTLLLLLSPLALNAYAANHEAPKDGVEAKSGDHAKSADHAKSGDHGEKKKKFPLGAVSFAFLVLGILAAPAYHRLNVGGDFTGSISTREESSSH
jgi:hypothetical protein